MEAHVVGASCHDGWFDSVTRFFIDTIFKEFWDLCDHDMQNAYLQRLVGVVPVKKKVNNSRSW